MSLNSALSWEQRKLGELVDVCSGRDYKHLSEGTIPVYGTGGYMLSVNDALSYDRDAIGIGRKGTIDRPYILKAPFWTVDTLFYAIPREKVDLNFAFDIFQNIDWKKKDESTGVPSLSKTAINDIDVLAPKHGEQQTIGQFFAAIDHLITLHQRKYEKLQKVKKSMLEKMFPKNVSKVPEIRFRGFTDDWEQRKLGDVVEDYVEKTTVEDQYPVLTSSQQKGIVLQDDYFSGERVSQNGNIGYFVIPRGYFTFRSRSDNDVFVFNRNDAVDMGIISYFYPVFKPKGVNSDFLLRRLNYGLEDQIKINSEGTGQHVLSLKKFKNIVGVFPSYEEQKKIGSYFSQIDHLITLHQRKCDEMKKMKKFMLQKMFPKNGQKNPEIRFDGFTDDWEQRKFSDYYKMSSGCAFKMSDYCEDGIGLINGESIQHGIINDDNLNHLPESFIEQYPDFILKEGDIVVGLNRPITNGNLKIARIPSKYNDSLLYQRAGKVVYKEECDRDFSYVLLSQEILKHTLVEAVGSDQPFISTSKLDKWQMMIPKDIEEQHKIGEYFSNLDNLITLHQRKRLSSIQT